MSNSKLSQNCIFSLRRTVLFVGFLFWGISVFSQSISVPENIQAALLIKVLKYNPQIPHDQKIKILVVYDTGTEINKVEFMKGLGNKMDVKAILPTELAENISGSQVVYFMPGIHGFSKLCRDNNVLSVTSTTRFVEQGEISLGFGIENNKPKILVNLSSLEKEGQSFSSDILRIGKIFK